MRRKTLKQDKRLFVFLWLPTSVHVIYVDCLMRITKVLILIGQYRWSAWSRSCTFATSALWKFL